MRLRVWLWIAAGVPALLALLWSVEGAPRAPEPMDWCEVWREPPPPLGARDLLDFGGGPMLLGQRLLALGLLPFGPLPVGWLLALATCAALLAVLEPRVRAFAALPLALVAFAPAFGGDWLLEARLRVFAPALCAAGAVWALARVPNARRAWIVAFAFAVAAVFLAREGPAVGFVLAPLVYLHSRQRGDPRPFVPLVLWLVIVNVATALARLELREATGVLWYQQPLQTAATWVGLVGGVITDIDAGVRVDELLLGGLVFGGLVVCGIGARRCAAAIPWLTLGGTGIAIAALLAVEWTPPRLAHAAARETAWSVLLAPIGVLGAAWVLGWRRVAVAGTLLLAVLSLLAWPGGRNHQVQVARLLRQSDALLVFADLDGVLLPAVVRPAVQSRAGREALARAGRLPVQLPDSDLRHLTQLPVPAEPFALLDGWTNRSVRGRVRRDWPGFATDLVLLARQRSGGQARLFAVVSPELLVPGDALPWSQEFADAEPFVTGERLSIHAFDGRQRAIVALGAPLLFDGAVFHTQDGQR